MGIEGIKETLGAELDLCTKSPDYKTVDQMLSGVMKLYENPDIEKGDRLKWAACDLTLKDEMYLLTGIPSSGKSTWLDNVVMNSISMHEYNWAIFSPESHPVELHLKQLIEIYTQTNFYGNYNYQRTTPEQIKGVIDKLCKSLYMMTPREENLTIEAILELMEYLAAEHGVNAFVLDPYNEFSHTRPSQMSETEYVSRFLGRVRAFINKLNVMVWIVAHPIKLRKEDVVFEDGTKGVDYPVPTAYDIAGSANFFNKPDVIVTVHRDKDIVRNPDNKVSINVQKVRHKTTGKIGAYWLKFNYNDGTYMSA
jgi:twinkle protein